MKDIIKSVEIKESMWVDEEFVVIFHLFDDAGQKFFDEVHHAVECELLPGADRDELCIMPNPWQASTIMVRGVLFALFDGELIVDSTRGWYSLWVGEQRFSIIWDTEKQEWTIQAEFSKRKEGLEAFDYTDYTGFPETFWIEPAKLIRDIFLSK